MKRSLKRMIGILLSLFIGGVMVLPVKAEQYDRARLMVEEYEIIDGTVSEGKDFYLKVMIKNVGNVTAAQNTILSVINTQGIIFPAENVSNQIYLGDIGPKQTKEVTLHLRVSEEISVKENIVLNLYFTFQDASKAETNNDTSIAIPLMGICSLEIEQLELADNCYAMKNAVLSSKIANNGNEDVYNIELHVKTQNGDEFVYDLGDIKVNNTNLYDNGIKLTDVGTQVLSAYLSYEDEDNNSYQTKVIEKEVRVLEDVSYTMSYGNERMDIVKSSINIAMVIVAIVIIMIYYRKTSKKITSGKEINNGK